MAHMLTIPRPHVILVRQAQRAYLEAASRYMRTSLREHAKTLVRDAGEQADCARQAYAAPQQHDYMRYVTGYHAHKQEYPAGVEGDGRASTALAGSELFDASVPPGVTATLFYTHSSALPSVSPATAPAAQLRALRLTPRASTVSPRIDLQLSPRNWRREQLPNSNPSLSLPSVRGVYDPMPSTMPPPARPRPITTSYAKDPTAALKWPPPTAPQPSPRRRASPRRSPRDPRARPPPASHVEYIKGEGKLASVTKSDEVYDKGVA